VAHDPIVTERVRDRDSLEPHFVFAEQEGRAAARLAEYRAAGGGPISS